MTFMRLPLRGLSALFLLPALAFGPAGCSQLERVMPGAPPAAGATAAVPEPVTGVSDAEKADEVAPEPEASGRLGVTIASLGDPGEAGLWLKTPLVDAAAKGRVMYEGKTADVELIPIPGEVGAGSRMSLAAFQALGAPITGLPEVEVFRN